MPAPQESESIWVLSQIKATVKIVRGSLNLAVKCTEPTDQLPSTVQEFSVDATITQSSFTYNPSTFTPALWNAFVLRPLRPRRLQLPDLLSVNQSRSHCERQLPIAMINPRRMLRLV